MADGIEELRGEVRRLRIRVDACRGALEAVITEGTPSDVERARALIHELDEEDVMRLQADVSARGAQARPESLWPPLQSAVGVADAEMVVRRDRLERLEAIEVAAREFTATNVAVGAPGSDEASALELLRDALAGRISLHRPSPPSYGWLRHPSSPPRGDK